MGDLSEDEISGGGPLEGTRGGVVGFEVVADGDAQLGDAQEAFALQALAGKFGEEALDLVEPGGVGGDEVEVPARVTGEPAHDCVSFVSGVIVEHGVDIEAGGRAILDLLEEGEELLVGVAGMATAPNLAGGHIERGEERDGAMPEVIVGVALGPAQIHG